MADRFFKTTYGYTTNRKSPCLTPEERSQLEIERRGGRRASKIKPKPEIPIIPGDRINEIARRIMKSEG